MKNNPGLSERIVNNFVRISASNSNIQKLVLFGSRVNGNYKYNSDIDLAYWCTGLISGSYYLEMEEAAELYRLDLLDISTIKEDLMLSEIQQGIVLFERCQENKGIKPNP